MRKALNYQVIQIKDRITINPSKKFTKELDELIELTGHKHLYGEIPKTLAFSVTFTLKTLKSLAKVIPYDPDGEMQIIFTSIKNIKKGIEKQEELEKLLKKP